MDIRCTVCADSIEMDYLHEVPDKNFDQAFADFKTDGCTGIGLECSPTDGRRFDPVAAAVYDMMGDDIDGAASMFEDAMDMGLY